MPADVDTTMMPASNASPLKTQFCPVCGSARVHYAFSIQHTRVLQCADCKFTARTHPNATLPAAGGSEVATPAEHSSLFESIRSQLLPSDMQASSLTFVHWAPDGDIGFAASEGKEHLPTSVGPVAVSVGQLDAFTDPLPSLRNLRKQLRPAQPVVFVYSNIHQDGAVVGTPQWEQRATERNAYIDTPTALTLLYRAGYRCLGVRRLRHRVSVDHFVKNPDDHTFAGQWRRRLLRLIPRGVRNRWHVNARSTHHAILAIPTTTEMPLVSVVIPVFNEAATAAKLIDSVLRVQLTGATLEVIVVESNSTDGSRDIVRRYESHERVRCIYEDRPQGKGHATRLGLEHARGDIIIIQDADLEYDVEDYPSLLNPIIQGHEPFVLGSRHGGKQHWKLRQFNKPFLASFYNFAHVAVTAYINILFGLNLRDPQTMFKVCRRDCIEGLTFHGDYFNFDYELLLKIVRKGYKPVEVPVNYRSRSHAEGKKIRMWRDAPLGLWMITKLRLTPLHRFLHIGEPIE